MTRCLAAIFVLWPLWGFPAAEEEGPPLPICSNEECNRQAGSETWNFCPICGRRYPRDEQTEGDRYQNGQDGFRIERPNKEWRFLLRGIGVETINEQATVGLTSEEVISVVIVDRVKKLVDLEDYLVVASPHKSFKGARQLERKDLRIGGLDAVKMKWAASVEGESFHFYYTFLLHRGKGYRIISWVRPEQDDAGTQKEIARLENSFRPTEK
jgi:hypothetical protein